MHTVALSEDLQPLERGITRMMTVTMKSPADCSCLVSLRVSNAVRVVCACVCGFVHVHVCICVRVRVRVLLHLCAGVVCVRGGGAGA